MKKTSSSFRSRRGYNRPYVFEFYQKREIGPSPSFPVMTHVFYAESVLRCSTLVNRLVDVYKSLGIFLEAKLLSHTDALNYIDVDEIIQHYDTQTKIPF